MAAICCSIANVVIPLLMASILEQKSPQRSNFGSLGHHFLIPLTNSMVHRGEGFSVQNLNVNLKFR